MTFFIACRQFDEAHSGLNIAAKLMEILKEYEIEDKSFHCISDSASNMIKGKLFSNVFGSLNSIAIDIQICFLRIKRFQ